MLGLGRHRMWWALGRVSSASESREWTAAGAYLIAAWLPVALVSYHLRDAILSADGGGFEFLSQSLNLRSSFALSFWQRLALYRDDLLAVGVLAPVLLLLLLRWLRPRGRGLAATGLCIPMLAVLFIEIKCFWEVGSFVSFSVLHAGLTDSGREFLPEYLHWSSLLKLLGAVVLVLALTVISVALDRRHALSHQALALAGGAGWLTVTAATGLAWLVPSPANPYQSSAFLQALRTFTGLVNDPSPPPTPVPLTLDVLLDRYRTISNAPVPNRNGPYTGKAGGYDVIFLVLETAPASCLDLDQPDALPPTMRKLARHSFIAPQHHSTYPYTVRAIFSIFTSWYPSNGPRDFIKTLDINHPALLAPGIVRSARNAGYRTAVFVPSSVSNWELDGARYRALGFDSAFSPPAPPPPTIGSAWDAEQRRAQARMLDLQTLRLLKEQIRQAVSAGGRYLFSFQPQYSHGPWPSVTDSSTEAQVVGSGVQLFTVIDRWLGEVTALLDSLGTLNRTLIVVVGDHGIRTRGEHPTFAAGTLDQITFRVPLMIFAPGILSRPRVIPWVTSHIDIAPSVADLLGLTSERGLEQGSPLWEPALAGRTTFFLARNYLGADGFYASGRISMLKYPIRTVFVSPWRGQLHFTMQDALAGNSSQAESVMTVLDDLTNLQNTWSNVMIPENFSALLQSPPRPRRLSATADAAAGHP